MATVPNGVIRVRADGSWSLIANLSAFLAANPVAHPEPDDFEPDGTWYSMVSVRGVLYAVEPNHGELDRITRSGDVSRVVDVSASQGAILLARQLRQLPRWLGQVRYNGPPPLHRNPFAVLEAKDYANNAAISADGRHVVFSSFATNLVAGDSNAELDVFRHDRVTRETIRISVATGGGQATLGQSQDPEAVKFIEEILK